MANQDQPGLFEDTAKSVDRIALDKLELDPQNPRFGNVGGARRSQAEVLDSIVGDYGIEDVISSLAVNGYFPAEPVIAVKQKSTGKFRVVEGNRRLAACLVLAGDPRAKNHAKRTQSYKALQQQHQQPPITEVPVIWFNEGESPKELISYLGVRHLAASMPWDSYAKAAWIARVIEEGQLTLDDISRMTGDQHNTIARLLHGYNVVDQLVDRGLFNPEASYRKGRGSNAEFAFSWVYTLLGYPAVRKRLGIPDTPRPNPIPDDRLEDAKVVILRLLGNRDMPDGHPALDDSRQIGGYAAAIADDTRFKLVRKGYTLDEIDAELQPPSERVSESFDDAEKVLGELVKLVAKSPPTSLQAAELMSQATKIRNLAVALQGAIMKAINDEGEETLHG